MTWITNWLPVGLESTDLRRFLVDFYEFASRAPELRERAGKRTEKMLIETKTVRACCPYCREQITLVVDCSIAHQVYIEDCEVCCRPISIQATADENGALILSLMDENS